MQGNRTLLAGPRVAVEPSEPPVFYSVPRAAQALGVSAMTLYRAINAGEFPAIKIRGRLRVLRAVVEEILEAARTQTVDVAARMAAPGPEHRERTPDAGQV
jgi:excisionase family DNA binding protein